MARLALAAHDPGGAAVLAAAAGALRAGGHELAWLPSGPASKLWREAGERVPEAMDAATATAILRRDRPALVLTGTGFGDYERSLWRAARTIPAPSLAVLDAWMNIERRFTPPGGVPEQPDVLGVPDDETRAEIAAAGWCRAPVVVIGQPHLAARTDRLKQRRQGRSHGATKRIVFFSEPIVEDYGPTARGFTQFEVATQIAHALAGRAGVVLEIKPHPREAEAEWQAWLARTPNASLAAEETETLLARVDGVLGMTTMVLLEARLAGIPALSVQPGRTAIVNAMLDSMVPVLARRDDVVPGLTAWAATLDRPVEPAAARDFLAGGGARLAAAVEEMLARPSGRA